MFWKALQILLFTMSHGYLWGFFCYFFVFVFFPKLSGCVGFRYSFLFFEVFWFSFFGVVAHEVWGPTPPEMEWTRFEQAIALQLPSPVAECSRSCPSGTCLKPAGSTAVREAVEMFIYIVLFYRRHAYSIDVVFTVAEEFLYAVSLASRSRLKDRVKRISL